MDKNEKDPPDDREIDLNFLLILKVALPMKESGKDRQFFLDYSGWVWDAMEMYYSEDLKMAISGVMLEKLITFDPEDA